ncbi:SNF2 helicase associated domain-containing protein [Lederbergia sp. NSJ-179]|uniref:SNF2 helicase associated domain-containing protein n=1 Tax=Lederbergia sp. NSJ-179 TaxID=2931402 RepID=UPI001FD54B00|nr:SNF2 helicase associated domain-containing protein [Lederbergia sp. NSJ-179]MCJ7842523.1 SNF2 helicase associated domain-containing protein [Lederbergia sp. NSJ-179]
MNIELNRKKIIEMCGTVSFKRGKAYYDTNKVTIERDDSIRCEAIVTGAEDFYVTIEKGESGEIRTKCSCPPLPSFKHDCQHIAAVLVAIYEQQRNGTAPLTQNQALTEGLFHLFHHKEKQSSRSQLHFENRQILDVEFLCRPIIIGGRQSMFGIEARVGTTKVHNIRVFLEQVKMGNPSSLSPSFTYHPERHCFREETDAVIQQLIRVTQDEKVYVDTLPNKTDWTFSNDILLIPPSSWERLIPLLSSAPLVKLEYDGNTFDSFSLSSEPLPLQFDLSGTTAGDYELKIKGLDQMMLLNAYRTALSEGRVVLLERRESERLSELNQMLGFSRSNRILIPHRQISDFFEKIVPGLKRLGEVHISGERPQTPLVAKLYLDRVKNRLLAGLEFHYEGVVIHPLEKELERGPVLIRDVEKEEAILQLMEESSFAQTEGGYFLHNEELEYEFLYHKLPKLEKLVQVYATTAVRSRIIKKNPPPRIKVGFKKNRTDWLEFKFEIDGIPERQIREVLAALEEKRKYYRLHSGALLSLETREFEEIQRFLHAAPIQDEDLESGLNVPVVRGFQLMDSTDDPDVFKLEESFRQFLRKIQDPNQLYFEVPKTLELVLHGYQKHGYRWMKALAHFGFGGILADDMGLGKTLQSIAFILSELTDIRKRKLPILIVCPSSLTYNWMNEFSKFASDLKVTVIDGHKVKRIALQKDVAHNDVVITSYPLLRTDIKWYEKQAFHTVFFDEAQAFKNPFTQTAKAVNKVQAEHYFALTGTPIENSLEELWSIFHVVFPELFQGLKEYSNLSRKKIIRRIRPFLLRRTKVEVLAELPVKTTSQESVELLPDQKKLYAAYLAKLRHDTLKHLDKDTLQKNRIRILAGLTRLRQICCHPVLFVDGYKGSSAKFEQLFRLLEEARLSGRRVLIFSQFTKMLQLIGGELVKQGQSYFYLDGQTPSEERVDRCQRFNAGERHIFLISLKAGGTGLNLTGADTVILYDTWWNPAVEEQAADRVHRIGQTKAVQVIKLVARGTIEEKMNELQEKKRHLIDEVIDAKKNFTTLLTEEDIREILAIQKGNEDVESEMPEPKKILASILASHDNSKKLPHFQDQIKKLINVEKEEIHYYTPNEVAKKLGLSDQTIRRMCERGSFEGAYKTEGGHWKIPEDIFITTREQDEIAEEVLKQIDRKNSVTGDVDEFDL